MRIRAYEPGTGHFHTNEQLLTNAEQSIIYVKAEMVGDMETAETILSTSHNHLSTKRAAEVSYTWSGFEINMSLDVSLTVIMTATIVN